VDASAMQLERHERGIHIVSAGLPLSLMRLL
jgi:hypothetical protein